MRRLVLFFSFFVFNCSTVPAYKFTSDYSIKVLCDSDRYCITQHELQVLTDDLVHFLEDVYPNVFWRERIKTALSERYGEHKLFAIKPTTRRGFECAAHPSGRCSGVFRRWDGADGRMRTEITVAVSDKKCIANNSFTHELVHLIVWAVKREGGHDDELLWDVALKLAKSESIEKLCKD